MSSLEDLNSMVLRCRSDNAREYIKDAVSCYSAGANRPAIVATWIAVVFDIIDKIRELALSGDNVASQELEKFEQFQAQLAQGNKQAIEASLAFEREILDKSKVVLQILDHQQHLDLVRLKEDRNRCAHPTFQTTETPYQPSAELARTHIRNAIEYLLKQPPVQGKAAIERIKKQVLSQYFPNNIDEAIQQLNNSAFQNPSDALVRNLIDSLLFGAFSENDGLYRKKSAAIALAAVLETRRNIAEPRIRLQVNKVAQHVEDNKMVILAWFCVVSSDCYNLLNVANKAKLHTFLEQGPEDEVLKCMPLSLEVDGLKEAALNRINSFDSNALSILISKGVKEAVISKAIEVYCQAGSWHRVNELTNSIILPIVDEFSNDDIRCIIEAPRVTGADFRGAGGFNQFLETVLEKQIVPTAELQAFLDTENLGEYMPAD